MADQITHVRSECVKCLQEDIETHLETITELTAKNARLRAALEGEIANRNALHRQLVAKNAVIAILKQAMGCLDRAELQREGDHRPAPIPEGKDAFPQAHRLALELECLILSCKDTVAVSKWWDSAIEALEQWREFNTAASDKIRETVKEKQNATD